MSGTGQGFEMPGFAGAGGKRALIQQSFPLAMDGLATIAPARFVPAHEPIDQPPVHTNGFRAAAGTGMPQCLRLRLSLLQCTVPALRCHLMVFHVRSVKTRRAGRSAGSRERVETGGFRGDAASHGLPRRQGVTSFTSIRCVGSRGVRSGLLRRADHREWRDSTVVPGTGLEPA